MRYTERYNFSEDDDLEPLAVKIRMPKKRHTLRNILFIILGIILIIAIGIFIYSNFIFDPLSPDIKNYPESTINFILYTRRLF